MSTSSVKVLLLINIAVMVSAIACSSNGKNLTGRNQNRSSSVIAPASPAPTLQAAERDLNEQLFKRLDEILVSDAGGTESLDNLLAVSSLLDQGADAGAKNSAGQTPLLVAAQNGHIKAMELLLGRART